MYKKEITKHEYVYSEQEQERLEEIQAALVHLTKCDVFSTEKMVALVEEMDEILTGTWSAPMPF